MCFKLIEQLKGEFIEILGLNQFDDPEIISLVNHPFFLAYTLAHGIQRRFGTGT